MKTKILMIVFSLISLTCSVCFASADEVSSYELSGVSYNAFGDVVADC